MKALSIRMPWAYLCARGIKNIENRTWDTNFRGRFYIHAGRRFDNVALHDQRLLSKQLGGLLDEQTGIHIAWLQLLWSKGISGIIGEATLVKVITESRSPWFDGPYGFCLADAELYKYIIPCRGRLMFFEPELTDERIDLSREITKIK